MRIQIIKELLEQTKVGTEVVNSDKVLDYPKMLTMANTVQQIETTGPEYKFLHHHHVYSFCFFNAFLKALCCGINCNNLGELFDDTVLKCQVDCLYSCLISKVLRGWKYPYIIKIRKNLTNVYSGVANVWNYKRYTDIQNDQ